MTTFPPLLRRPGGRHFFLGWLRRGAGRAGPGRRRACCPWLVGCVVQREGGGVQPDGGLCEGSGGGGFSYGAWIESGGGGNHLICFPTPSPGPGGRPPRRPWVGGVRAPVPGVFARPGARFSRGTGSIHRWFCSGTAVRRCARESRNSRYSRRSCGHPPLPLDPRPHHGARSLSRSSRCPAPSDPHQAARHRAAARGARGGMGRRTGAGV